ncbi:hypothetical protein FPZ47_00115 [Mycobacterium helveticum]|uniref:Uncharacterized protein n=1 Tax=Mycobacterium helveticum TaxID=2592811 RepID=A0A557Y1H9_9MYCO|nr:hypothetical protein FPZ46_02710 [Mycobacterium helveticum]TVS92455.1 hypothetical protein FPZ47_00115 [Mycobacterium helveticum]
MSPSGFRTRSDRKRGEAGRSGSRPSTESRIRRAVPKLRREGCGRRFAAVICSSLVQVDVTTPARVPAVRR